MALKDNLKTARKAKGWSQADLAREAGASQQLISQIENGVPSAGKDQLPSIAAALGIEVTDLDRDFWNSHPALKVVRAKVEERRDTPPPASVALPLYAAVRGGHAEMVLENNPIGIERHPLEGVRDAYAVYVVGESMEPVFRQGDQLLVNPHIPPSPGVDVILQSETLETGERYAMVKRLVRPGHNEWRLKQFNPAKEFTVPRAAYPECHVIVGKYSRLF